MINQIELFKDVFEKATLKNYKNTQNLFITYDSGKVYFLSKNQIHGFGSEVIVTGLPFFNDEGLSILINNLDFSYKIIKSFYSLDKKGENTEVSVKKNKNSGLFSDSNTLVINNTETKTKSNIVLGNKDFIDTPKKLKVLEPDIELTFTDEILDSFKNFHKILKSESDLFTITFDKDHNCILYFGLDDNDNKNNIKLKISYNKVNDNIVIDRNYVQHYHAEIFSKVIEQNLNAEKTNIYISNNLLICEFEENHDDNVNIKTKYIILNNKRK